MCTFEEVKERIDTLNVYLVEREYDKEEPEKITSAQLLGGVFNRKGFIPDNQALVQDYF